MVKLFVSPANFKRPIVILGPLNDVAMDKLAREMPDEYEVAGWCSKKENLKSFILYHILPSLLFICGSY